MGQINLGKARENAMTIAIEDVAAAGWARRSPLEHGRTVGPVTAAKQRRTALVYLALCVIGITPSIAGWAPSWQAAGLGLWFPGAGFIARTRDHFTRGVRDGQTLGSGDGAPKKP